MKSAWKMFAYKDVRNDELNFLENSGAGVHVAYVTESIDVIDTYAEGKDKTCLT